MNFPSREEVEAVRQTYPNGTRVELVKMDDPYTKLRQGDLGTVNHVDDAGTVFVKWDCGPGLGVVYGVDEIKIVKEESV
jgi:hypothetical protein